MKYQVGDLQVWWFPQVPCKSFKVDVASIQEGAKILEVLANYDLFQLAENIKPDFCNEGGLNRWCANCDGEGNPGWESWYDEETGEEDIENFLSEVQK